MNWTLSSFLGVTRTKQVLVSIYTRHETFKLKQTSANHWFVFWILPPFRTHPFNIKIPELRMLPQHSKSAARNHSVKNGWHPTAFLAINPIKQNWSNGSSMPSPYNEGCWWWPIDFTPFSMVHSLKAPKILWQHHSYPADYPSFLGSRFNLLSIHQDCTQILLSKEFIEGFSENQAIYPYLPCKSNAVNPVDHSHFCRPGLEFAARLPGEVWPTICTNYEFAQMISCPNMTHDIPVRSNHIPILHLNYVIMNHEPPLLTIIVAINSDHKTLSLSFLWDECA